MTVTSEQWTASRDALARAGERFAALVSAVPDPAAKATAHWTIADTAAHVVSIAWLYAALARPDITGFPIPELADQAAATTVDTVSDLNVSVMRIFRERDSQVLVGRLRGEIQQLLSLTEERDPAEPVPWIGSARVPVAGLLAHLVNELLIHGHDIAKAVREPWDIPPADASLFLNVFLVGVTRCGPGHLLDGDQPALDRRIAVEFRCRYAAPATLVLHRGTVTVDESGRDVDVRVSYDPSVLNLMMFGRVSRLRALLTGKVRITGPRPWLLPVFLRTLRMPS